MFTSQVMKLVITGYCLYFQFHYYAKFLTHAKMNNTELYLIHCTFLNVYKKFTSFCCQVINEMHAKKIGSIFLPHGV